MLSESGQKTHPTQWLFVSILGGGRVSRFVSAAIGSLGIKASQPEAHANAEAEALAAKVTVAVTETLAASSWQRIISTHQCEAANNKALCLVH